MSYEAHKITEAADEALDGLELEEQISVLKEAIGGLEDMLDGLEFEAELNKEQDEEEEDAQ